MTDSLKHVTLDDHRIAYRDQGSGPVVVFVHGTPSSSVEFAAVIDAIAPQFRCIAIDHLGFGESDKPQAADYSIGAHSRRLSALLEHLGVGQYHLVVHDFGGAIALPLASADPSRILSLTLMNTWLWPLAETEPALVRQLPLLRSRLMEWLYRRFNFSARVLVKAAWGTHRPLKRHQHQRYMAAFPTADQRSGTIAFLKALLDPAEPAWARWRELDVLKHVPAQILWGMGDAMVTPKTLGRWREILPAATVVELPRVGHFISDEAPELVARYCCDFFCAASASFLRSPDRMFVIA